MFFIPVYGGLEGSAEGSLILSLTSQPLCEGFKINWPVGEARISAVCNLFSDHSRPLNLPRWPFKSGPRKQVMLFKVFQHILASVMSLLENAKRCVSVLNTAVAGAIALREKGWKRDVCVRAPGLYRHPGLIINILII